MRPVVVRAVDVRPNGILYTLSILTEKIDYQYKCLRDGWDQNSFTLQNAFSILDENWIFQQHKLEQNSA